MALVGAAPAALGIKRAAMRETWEAEADPVVIAIGVGRGTGKITGVWIARGAEK
jgi:hypothetical protein